MPLYILLPILLNLGVPGTHGRLDNDLGRRLSLGDVPCNFHDKVIGEVSGEMFKQLDHCGFV